MLNLHPTLLQRLLDARDACDGVSTDTRSELRGMMYFALRGANFDGNAFVGSALEAGALHAVTTDTTWEGHERVTVVPEELGALQRLACSYRQRWTCPVLAMTGSNGKTTTKELIRDVLATTFQVHATLGNLNNHIGVPLTLLNAPKQPEFVVVEMGANHRHDIALLAQIAQPTHGYITNIGLAHLEGFGGERGVYLGKKELFDYLADAEGFAFVQTSEPKVVEAAAQVSHSMLVDTAAWQWTSTAGQPARVVGPDGTSFPMHLEGSYNLPNAVAALRIGEHFGVPLELAKQALSAYTPSNHRSQVVQTDRNWVLLDAYNANPSSCEHALRDFIARNHACPLAVLGDMAELGKSSEEAHRKVAQQALSAGIPLWTVGRWFGQVHDSSPSDLWKHWPDFDTLVAHLIECPLSNRHILVKGSRSAALERLMPYL